MSLAMPPVAATLPATSELSDVVSISEADPEAAMSCPFLSTTRIARERESCCRRSATDWIRRTSSSYITSWGVSIAKADSSGGGTPSEPSKLVSASPRPKTRESRPLSHSGAAAGTSETAAVFERSMQGRHVGVLELATDSDARGDPRDLHAERSDEPRQIQCRRIAFDVGARGHDDFGDRGVRWHRRLEAAKQRVHAQVCRADAT